MMRPPKPYNKTDNILEINEGCSEKSQIEEPYDEMYANHQASKNIRQI